MSKGTPFFAFRWRVFSLRYLLLLLILVMPDRSVWASGNDPIFQGPDLQINYLSLDASNSIEVAVSNHGSAAVPFNGAKLSLFVDHLRVADFELDSLADQSFRTPGGQTIVQSGIRISGSSRRILAFIDSGQVIEEEDDFRNTMSYSANPSAQNGFDITVEAEVDSQDRLFFTISNEGNQPSPVDLEIDFLISVDYIGQAETFHFREVLPTLLPAGNETLIQYPTDPILVSEPTPISLSFRVDGETDNSNNGIEGKLHYITIADIDTRYADLLTNPLITNSMYWRGLIDYPNYSAWPSEMKDELRDNLLLLEQGKPLPIDAPPTTFPVDGVGGYIAPEDARKIYLLYVAHSLWFEKNGGASWSLTDYSATELARIFNSQYFVIYSSWDPELDVYYFDNATAWNPRIAFSFMRHMGMLRPSPEETTFALLDWFRGYVRHNWGFEVLPENQEANFGYVGPIPIDKIIYPHNGFDHVTHGCWGTSNFLAKIAGSINIPANRNTIAITSNFPAQTTSLHNHIAFPSLRKSPADDPGIVLYHSDQLVNQRFYPRGVGDTPTNELFYTFEEFDPIENPQPPYDCREDEPTLCNNFYGQRAQNNGRENSLLAEDYLPGYFLDKYCTSSSTLDDYLRGFVQSSGVVIEFAKPFLDLAERTAFLSAAETRLLEIGDNDLGAACEVVESRFDHIINTTNHPSVVAPKNSNQAPSFGWVPDQFVDTYQTVSFAISATDPESEAITYTLVSAPPGATLQGVQVEWDAGSSVGLHSMVIQASDPSGGVSQQIVNVSVETNATPCTTVADCADQDGDGVRDDVCTWWKCEGGFCSGVDPSEVNGTPIPYGDMGSAFGVCEPDGAVDVHDRFHAINCFGNIDLNDPQSEYPCDNSPYAFNVDVASATDECMPDGICDINDAFAALNVFAGTSPCSCPTQ